MVEPLRHRQTKEADNRYVPAYSHRATSQLYLKICRLEISAARLLYPCRTLLGETGGVRP